MYVHYHKHGVSSPVFSYDLWSLSEQWGLFSLVRTLPISHVVV